MLPAVEGAGRNGALDSARPRARAERFVSGVPAALSAGGACGLPDLPREGRGFGVVSETRDLGLSRGVRGIEGYMARGGVQGNSSAAAAKGLLTSASEHGRRAALAMPSLYPRLTPAMRAGAISWAAGVSDDEREAQLYVFLMLGLMVAYALVYVVCFGLTLLWDRSAAGGGEVAGAAAAYVCQRGRAGVRRASDAVADAGGGVGG
jgi:hypothetical protein